MESTGQEAKTGEDGSLGLVKLWGKTNEVVPAGQKILRDTVCFDGRGDMGFT